MEQLHAAHVCDRSKPRKLESIGNCHHWLTPRAYCYIACCTEALEAHAQDIPPRAKACTQQQQLALHKTAACAT